MCTIHVNVKVKVTQQHDGAGTEELYVFSTSTLDDDGWPGPRPAHLTQGEGTRYPLYKRLGGPQVDWAGVENISCNGFRIPDRSARSESLYRLSYRGCPDVSSFMLIWSC